MNFKLAYELNERTSCARRAAAPAAAAPMQTTISLAECARAAASCRLVARKFLMRRRVTIDGVLPDLIDDETRAAGGSTMAHGCLINPIK